MDVIVVEVDNAVSRLLANAPADQAPRIAACVSSFNEARPLLRADAVLLLSEDTIQGDVRLIVRQAKAAGSPVLICGSQPDLAMIRDALDAGAAGYVNLTDGSAFPLHALNAAQHGKLVLPPDLARGLMNG